MNGVYFMDNANGVIRRTDDNLIYFESEPFGLKSVYYGKSLKPTTITLTEDEILSNFNSIDGNVGSSDGKLYNFSGITISSAQYLWICVKIESGLEPQLPEGDYVANDPTKVINYTKPGTKSAQFSESWRLSGEMTYRQMDPSGTIESLGYAVKTIRGVQYRMYRSSTIYSYDDNNIQYVYSFD